ncbi:MAG: ComF family protein [Chloroflexi bacterium]|nr:ComF family protein [Chloroflexota bacterium]
MPVPQPVCAVCGQPSAISPCLICLEQRPSFTALRAVALFEGPVREAVHRLKYGNRTATAGALSELLLQTWLLQGWHAQLVTSVPLHPRRERSRGYNQATALARPLARALGIPFRDHLLLRVRFTADQIGLGVAERRHNMTGAFVVSGQCDITGKTVLIVDDVATTGSTLSACAAALRNAGASKVYGLALARQTVG